MNPLSDDELRIKVAELCGWRRVDVYEWKGEVRLPKQYHIDLGGGINNLPDYCSDLNEMHAIVIALGEYRRALFDYSLLQITNPDHDRLARNWTDSEYSKAISATARQQAEAFVKVMQDKNKS